MNGLVYLDTCIVIYLVERHPAYFYRLAERMLGTERCFCHSMLVEPECLVMPLRLGRNNLVEKYHDFFLGSICLPMQDSMFLHAAELRAHHGLKTPDALHLASAMHHACLELWTNDDRMVSVAPKLAVNVLRG
ncbi:MAG: type II toxin-antitoxin system VapC family toxin [Magnetococcales bacterium]|nr:type II toxin-antitoxin system VapC family toxin [Magnetococcales bacterium]